MTEADDFAALYGDDERALIDAWVGWRDPDEASSGVGGWRRTSAGGALVTAVLLGLREALEPPPTEEVLLVVDADGEPVDPDAPVELRFDPEEPAATTAVVRTWAMAPPEER